MRLGVLIEAIHGRLLAGSPEVEVSGVTHDSRAVIPGHSFVAVDGLREDGRRFAPDAMARGAVAVVSSKSPLDPIPQGVAWVVVEDSRWALSLLADALHGHPTRRLQVVGVTGTNGKTTTTFLLAAALEAAGKPCAVIGTIETRVCGERRKSTLTTPEASLVHALAAEHACCGGGALAMEISSHALELRRADHVDLDAAIFTNLTQDHLDFHPTWQGYLDAKRRLFSELLGPDRTAVVNADDPHAPEMTRGCRARVVRFSMDPRGDADIAPIAVEGGIDGFKALLRTPWGKLEARCRLVGSVNVQNLMGALGAAASLGHEPAVLLEGMARLDGGSPQLDQ